jgi:hypothetical protein
MGSGWAEAVDGLMVRAIAIGVVLMALVALGLGVAIGGLIWGG